MPATDLADCSAAEMLQRFRTRTASPVEARRAAPDRIERHPPRRRAFVRAACDEALDAARRPAAHTTGFERLHHNP